MTSELINDFKVSSAKKRFFTRRVRRRATRFWATDWSLTVLLILLVGNLFILPLAQFATWGRLLARSVLSLIIISGLLAAARFRYVALAAALSLGSLVMGWVDMERPNLYRDLFNDFYSLLFIGVLVVLILQQVLRGGPITPRRVQGSVAIYLLLGLLWAISYEIVELLEPGSFALPFTKGNVSLPQLAYFSFTTLTTLGFGDVLPVRPFARSLVVLEALMGQLFPVVLITRLVTMEIEHHRRPDQ